MLLKYTALFLIMAFIFGGVCTACEHDHDNEDDDTVHPDDGEDGDRQITAGSGTANTIMEEVVNCSNTINEQTAPGKFDGSSELVKIRLEEMDNNLLFLNSDETPSSSESKKWRIHKCQEKNKLSLAVLIWGNFQDGDYLQVNRRLVRGTTRCSPYYIPIIDDDKSTILMGLHNASGKASFQAAVFCYKGEVKNLMECDDVREAVGTSKEMVSALQNLGSSTLNFIRKVNDGTLSSSDENSCKILQALSKSCLPDIYISDRNCRSASSS